MFYVFIFWPFLIASAVLTLTIDSHLGTSVEDCFERVSIGEQLPSSGIYRNVSELTTKECDQICKQDKQCQSYGYGVGAKGNSSCDLSNLSENDIKEKNPLQRNPDYDVYARRFQCEQSPPKPMDPQFGETGPDPQHRPVFRPDEDNQQPLSDDYESRPYGPIKANYNQNERPDGYSQKPSYSRPPTYGDHKPQDIPYRPRPRPNYHDVINFNGNRPQSYRPDPYHPEDVQDVQDIYGPKPIRPQLILPDYTPEKPQYQYIVRPNRRPPAYPEQDVGYNKPVTYNEANNPGYGQRPYKPSYNYNSQYASNYGNAQDNSIYVEIYDPPRPYRPHERPYNGYGPGSSAQNYGQSYGHNSNSYNHNSWSQSDYGPNQGYRPQKPTYGTGLTNDNNYIKDKPSSQNSYSHSNNYGQNSQVSQATYSSSQQGQERPGYGQNQNSYRPNYGQTTPSYGSQNSNSYGTTHSENYDNPNSGSSYGSNNSPTYSSSQNYGTQNTQSYGVSQSQNSGVYGTSQSYGTQNSQSYGGIQSSTTNGYGASQSDGSQNSQSYGISHNSNGYATSQNYGSQNSYATSQGQNSHTYGSSHTSSSGYATSQNYGTQNSYGLSPSYGNQNQYSKPNPGYGDSSKPNYDDNSLFGSHLGYGTHHLYDTYDKPAKPHKPIGYNDDYNQTLNDPGNVRPVYESVSDKPDAPSYISRPNGNIITTRPVTIVDYEEKPYGRNPEISFKACFRRVLAGRRALRSYVRRVVDCERLEDCRRECAIEKRFHCESFNYRLDPSFKGKGLCELMTRPIEAFDIRNDFVDDKDYDFYELDRNSLEPNCPETLRGPGLLHSGFLSSKGEINDRSDWSGYKEYNRYDERRHYNQRKRYEDVFVPYQIGFKTKNNENWGQYGGNYGGNTYYKDRSDFHKSFNHWRLSDLERQVKVIRDFNYKNLGRHDSQYDSGYQSLGRHDSHYGYGDYKKYGEYASGYESLGKHYYDSGYEILGRQDSQHDFGHPKHHEYASIESLGKNRHFDSTYEDLGTSHDYIYGNWRKWSGESHNKFDVHDFEGRSDDDVKDCSSRRSPGMSLGNGAIRRSIYARTVVDCEAACFGEREFKCVSYSYRYSSPKSSDNCFLSERPYKGLDMSADSDSDVYAMPQHQGCHTVSTKPWVESECFWHVRSGSVVTGAAVKSALTVTGLGACEAECIRAHNFFCRGFSFRFDSATIGDDLENCILTSSPPTSLENGHGLRPSGGHELYARGNYGRGCEPAIYDDVQQRDAQCYLQYDSAARLTPSAVRGKAWVKDDRACGKTCNDAPFRCLSFSFNNKAPPHTENCLLSEIRLFDLQRGVDYEHSGDDLLYAFDLFNGQCWRKVYGKYEVPSLEVPRPLSASVHEHYGSEPPTGPETYISASGPSGPSFSGPEPPVYVETRPNYKPEKKPYIETGYKPFIKPYIESSYKPIYEPISSYLPESGPSGPSGPFRISTSKPYIESEPYLPLHKPESYRPYKPVYLPEKPYQESQRPSYSGGDELISSSFRHYSVSGFPCRRGTTCEQNHIAGHWACEPEGGEIGSWDYCCSPSHRCGYSEGFKKPWCYVGPTHEQWRPCSEKYYPYYQHNVPHPSLGHREAIRPRPDGPVRPQGDKFIPASYLPEADRRYWDDLYKNGPKAYYDKYGNALPGYSRVPIEDGPYIKYERNPSRPSSGNWVKLPHYDEPQAAGGLGIPRYWPIAYLHKDSPPNSTYFRFNETAIRHTEPTQRPDIKKNNLDKSNNGMESRSIEDNHRNQKHRNISQVDEDNYELPQDKSTTYQPESTTLSTTFKPETTTVDLTTEREIQQNLSQLESPNDKYAEDYDIIKGIDGKLNDFTKSIEVFDLDDAKAAEKFTDVKTLEAEERQIEAIGRILAAKRGGKVIDKSNLSTDNIAVDKHFMDFNFNNRFPTERRGTVKRISKEDLRKEISNDKSLEVSETTYVRPPRILTTTENIRKAIVNGKVFYDATIRDQRELIFNSTRKVKSLRLEDRPVNSNTKKNIRQRNVNPVRRVKRVYKKRYNPDEVRKRLLEREKNKNI